MDLQAGEHTIHVDLVGELTPQQYIQQLLTQHTDGRRQEVHKLTMINHLDSSMHVIIVL